MEKNGKRFIQPLVNIQSPFNKEIKSVIVCILSTFKWNNILDCVVYLQEDFC